MKPYKPTTLDFSHAAAFKLLQAYRHEYIGLMGLMYLGQASVHVTDVERKQVLIGAVENGVLNSRFINIGGGRVGELFDGLCALCSSAEPLIERHLITESRSASMVAAWDSSRLGLYTIKKEVSYNSNLAKTTLTATVKYPT